MADNIKIGFAALLIVAGLVGFYWFSQSPMIARVGMVLAGLALAATVAWFSKPGRDFVEFARESITEVKKVVWPTRKESMQSAAAVFAFVFVMAAFLWIVDKGLEWALYDLILGSKR